MARITAAIAILVMVGSANADVILSTDFSGRTVSGLTASNITWATNGVADPGDLTAVENENNGQKDTTTENTGLFDTSSTAAAIALNLNVNNEDGWYVDVPLVFAGGTASLDITTLDLSMQNFNNNGDAQSVGRQTVHRAEIIGDSSGVVATDSGSYNLAGVYSDVFDLTLSLGSGENWTLRIYADFISSSGNNTGYQSILLNGTVNPVPEPALLGLLAIGGLAMFRRRNI